MLSKKIASFALAVVLSIGASSVTQVHAAELEIDFGTWEIGNDIYYAKDTVTGEVDFAYYHTYHRDPSYYSMGAIALTETDTILSILSQDMGLTSADNVLSFEWRDHRVMTDGVSITDVYRIKKADGTYFEGGWLRSGGVWGNGYVYLLETGGTAYTDLYLYTEDFKTAEILPFNGNDSVYGKDGLYFFIDSFDPVLYISYNLKEWGVIDGELLKNADETELYIKNYDYELDDYFVYKFDGKQTWEKVDVDYSTLETVSEPPKRITSLKLVTNIGEASTAQTENTPAPAAQETAVAVNSDEKITGNKAVTADFLNVRTEGNTKSKIIGTLKKGDVVNIQSITNGWAKIDYNGKTAYVSDKYLGQVSTPAPTEQETATPSQDITTLPNAAKVVNCDALNVRSGAGVSHAAFNNLKSGDVIQILDKKGNWYQIETDKGVKGWVYGAYLDVQ